MPAHSLQRSQYVNGLAELTPEIRVLACYEKNNNRALCKSIALFMSFREETSCVEGVLSSKRRARSWRSTTAAREASRALLSKPQGPAAGTRQAAATEAGCLGCPTTSMPATSSTRKQVTAHRTDSKYFVVGVNCGGLLSAGQLTCR